MTTLGEASGKYFMNKNGIITQENELELEFEKAKREKEVDEARKIYVEAAQKKQEEIEKKLAKLEILPNSNKVIILPYPENPYRQITTKSGIITDYSGEFMNPDSGELDRQKEMVACAKIIEVGPECKYAKEGDDVFFDTRTTYPFPFQNMGYQLTSEPQLLCFINEDLKNRFKK